MNYKKLEKRKGSDNMKCGNVLCINCISNVCVSSQVFLNGPEVCRLQQLRHLCIGCQKNTQEKCLNCINYNK